MSTASSSSKPAVILVGLPLNLGPPQPIKVPWSDKPVSIIQEANDVTKILHAKGYDTFKIVGVIPGQVAAQVPAYLKERHWDAMVVGGGLKGIPEMTESLEELVNTTKDISPKTRIMFLSKGPMSVLESIERLEKIMSSQ